MLFILLFIALMVEHRKCTNIKIMYVSDNLEPINRNKKHLNYTDMYPINTTSDKLDITEEIYLTINSYEIEASL